jgi:hypothetical protein
VGVAVGDAVGVGVAIGVGVPPDSAALHSTASKSHDCRVPREPPDLMQRNRAQTSSLAVIPEEDQLNVSMPGCSGTACAGSWTSAVPQFAP